MIARITICKADALAELGYNYLRTIGTADSAYFRDKFQQAFRVSKDEIAAAYPALATTFSRGADSIETAAPIIGALFSWKMNYFRFRKEGEFYVDAETGMPYTGLELPGTPYKINRPALQPLTPEERGRTSERLQKRLERLLRFAPPELSPASSTATASDLSDAERSLATWFTTLSSLTSWQPTFRILTPATTDNALTASITGCLASTTNSFLPDALEPPGFPAVIRTPATPVVPVTPVVIPVGPVPMTPVTPAFKTVLIAPMTYTFAGGPGMKTWSFGDGTTSNEDQPTHVYARPGTYPISLTQPSSDGGQTFSSSLVVTASGGVVGPMPGTLPVTIPVTTPGTAPAPSDGINVGLVVTGVAIGWLLTRFL